MATGITSLALNSDSSGEIYNVTGTSVQIDALTNVTNANATGQFNIIISDAGSVSWAGATMSNIDAVSSSAANAMAMTSGTAAMTYTQTGTGTATTSFTVGAATTATSGVISAANAAQVFTATSTGAVTVNLPFATAQDISGDTASNGTWYDAGDLTVTIPAGATATLSISGAATANTAYGAAASGTIGTVRLDDADFVFATTAGASVANFDVISLGGITANATIDYGTALSASAAAAGQNVTSILQAAPAAGAVIGTSTGTYTSIAETGTTQYSYTLATDSGNGATSVLVVTGFDTGVTASGGDVLNLGGTITTVPGVVGTGTVMNLSNLTVAQAVVLSGSTYQIAGQLSQTANAGAVEAAVIAAGITTGAYSQNAIGYVALDNGVDTGVYRLQVVANGGTANALDAAADFTVALVAVLVGVSDCSALVAANIV